MRFHVIVLMVHPRYKKKNIQCTCNVTLRCIRVTIVAVEKQKSITYSECGFVALVIQAAKRISLIKFSFVACQALLHFYTLSHKRHDFRWLMGGGGDF